MSLFGSILRGIGSLLDLGGTQGPTLEDYRSTMPGLRNDEEALASDWRTVGEDFNRVMVRHEGDTRLKGYEDGT